MKGFAAEDDHYVGMDLDRPPIDFLGLARALGVPGERVEKAADVPAAKEFALSVLQARDRLSGRSDSSGWRRVPRYPIA